MLTYAGSLYVKTNYNNDSNDTYKAWFAIITCASIPSLVPNFTSESCIKVLRRFVRNRELPQVIISDNGKNLTTEGAQNFVKNVNINWKFNTEVAH